MSVIYTATLDTTGNITLTELQTMIEITKVEPSNSKSINLVVQNSVWDSECARGILVLEVKFNLQQMYWHHEGHCTAEDFPWEFPYHAHDRVTFI